jgi:tol-pal system protein YbgF
MRYLVVFLFLVIPGGIAYAQSSSQMLEMQQQLTRLENEVRQLRGEVERLSHENKRLKNQQNDLYTDLDQRMRAIQAGAPANQLMVESVAPTTPPASTGSATVTMPPVAGTVPASSQRGGLAIGGQPTSVSQPVTSMPVSAPADPAKEQESYKAAFDLLKVGKYNEAILAYSDFLRQYPSGTYAPNAQYWLGEANYVTRQFPVAIEEFQKVINRYPESRKLPDAMLKIGYIHYELKQSDDARRVLTGLTKKFPGTTAARLAENRLQRMKLEGR